MSRTQPRRVSAFVKQRLWDVYSDGIVLVDQVWEKYRSVALRRAKAAWGPDAVVEKSATIG
jgi:hypothetical protein